MTLRIATIMIDAVDIEVMSSFWCQALDYEDTWTGPSGGHLLTPRDGSDPPVALMPGRDEKVGKNRLHLDLRPDDQPAEVRRLEALGAHQVGIGQRDVSWVVMADPEGNEFCVLRGAS